MITEAELDAALVRELCTGRQLNELLENKQELAAAQEAMAMKGHKTLQSLGKAVASIPTRTFFEIAKHHGAEFWQDKGEVRHFLKKNPHLKSHEI